MPLRINYKIYQGSTFNEVLRWASTRRIYKTITAITQAAPAVVTATAHSVPEGWPVKITNVGGMTEINSTEDYHTATILTVNTIELNDINSVGYKAYTSGGILEYFEPVDLTGVTARMQIRETIDSTTVIHELTSENGGITIDALNSTITLTISATDTAAFSFTKAVYSLELISAGVVTPYSNGDIFLIKEVTR